MDLGALLAGRRSTRRFDTGRDVPDDVLARVLAAPLAMPHAGNTYDWRAVVLRRRHRDHERWPAIHAALLGQGYVDEAAVVVAWAVQPGWWAERYRANVDALVEQGLIDPVRHAGLLDLVQAGPGDDMPLTTLLVGEAMMGVAAAMLAALDAGLGATVTACRPKELTVALGLPPGAVPCPAGVLALGWPVPEDSGRVVQPAAGPPPAVDAPASAGSVRAPKPALDGMYFAGVWGRPLAGPGS